MNNRRLLLSPLWFLVALATIIGLNATSAAAGSTTETRVRAFEHVTVDSVGQQSSERPGSVGCVRPETADLAVGSCVATNNALRGPDGRFATNPNSAQSTAGPSSSTHGNSLASDRPTTLYQLTDAESGAHLKWGISSNPGVRYSAADLEGKIMTPIQTGTRADMAAVERQLVERLPGPLNHEPWAGAQLGNFRFV